VSIKLLFRPKPPHLLYAVITRAVLEPRSQNGSVGLVLSCEALWWGWASGLGLTLLIFWDINVMRIKDLFSYRKLQHEWASRIVTSLEEIPDDIFFEEDGSPLKKHVAQLDKQLYQRLITKFGQKVKKEFAPMIPENKFAVDILLPTEPMTLIEIEKGKLPRLELDIMKIINSIYSFPSKYGFGCIILPDNYIKLPLAGRRSPYQYLTNNLIPLNSPLLDRTNQDGSFLVKDFIVIGYVDPRG
jgi:hypothetical protein